MFGFRIEAINPERGMIMSKQPIVSGIARFSRKVARIFGYRMDHPAEVIVGFRPGAFR
jgi:hypothetical protein